MGSVSRAQLVEGLQPPRRQRLGPGPAGVLSGVGGIGGADDGEVINGWDRVKRWVHCPGLPSAIALCPHLFPLPSFFPHHHLDLSDHDLRFPIAALRKDALPPANPALNNSLPNSED